MRFAILGLPLALVACGRAEALQPDSHNPAHCIAAFNYGAYWFKVGNRPDKATAMLVRGAYEMNKVKVAGRAPGEALAEAKALTQAYVRDEKAMDTLFQACEAAQNSDPRFRAEYPGLLARMKELRTRMPAY